MMYPLVLMTDVEIQCDLPLVDLAGSAEATGVHEVAVQTFPGSEAEDGAARTQGTQTCACGLELPLTVACAFMEPDYEDECLPVVSYKTSYSSHLAVFAEGAVKTAVPDIYDADIVAVFGNALDAVLPCLLATIERSTTFLSSLREDVGSTDVKDEDYPTDDALDVEELRADGETELEDYYGTLAAIDAGLAELASILAAADVANRNGDAHEGAAPHLDVAFDDMRAESGDAHEPTAEELRDADDSGGEAAVPSEEMWLPPEPREAPPAAPNEAVEVAVHQTGGVRESANPRACKRKRRRHTRKTVAGYPNDDALECTAKELRADSGTVMSVRSWASIVAESAARPEMDEEFVTLLAKARRLKAQFTALGGSVANYSNEADVGAAWDHSSP